jgi:adenosylmethionine-8-amino-7-oxononanoate aminotransferase
MSSGGSLLSTSLTTGEEANARIVGGHGVWLQLSDGRQVIDASNTWCQVSSTILTLGSPVSSISSAASERLVTEQP